MYFSKSKYCGFWQCPKMAWLDKYKPEEKVIDASDEVRYRTGHNVGDLAKTLFGDYVETTVIKEDGKQNMSAMIEKTEQEIAKGTENICEAAFSYKGLYCAVDILHKEKDGYAIYEVKSKTYKYDDEDDDDGPISIYLVDIAYQKYVLEKSGIKVTGTYLVRLNKNYRRHGDIDAKELFFIIDVGNFIKDEYDKMCAAWEEIQSKYGSLLNSHDVLEEYTSIRYQTKLEAGVAVKHSLHNMRVVNPGLVFHGLVELAGDSAEEYLPFLLLAIRNIRSAGMKRNRGFGSVECRISLKDGRDADELLTAYLEREAEGV